MAKERAASSRRQSKKTVNGSTSSIQQTGTSPQEDSKQSPREARRQQRIEISREQILDTAEQIFAERGYYETGLKDVAARCEFSVGSIYSFFESKDDLYETVLMRRGFLVESIMESTPESLPGDERLVNLAEMQIQHAKDYPSWGALTAEITWISRRRGALLPDAWRHYNQRNLRTLQEAIERGQKDGSLREGSSLALARLFQAVVMSFILVSTVVDDEEGSLSDPEEFLNFLHDTFSSRPHRDLDIDQLDE